MTSQRLKNSVVSIHSRIREYPEVFRNDSGIMFCIYCDKSIDWKHKSTIDSHVNKDLIEAFVGADIPLQKVDKLLPFFKKHLREGGAIPKAPTLRQ
ncbi:8613_t:CDS:2, partial [Entrophospora sp. SA101]